MRFEKGFAELVHSVLKAPRRSCDWSKSWRSAAVQTHRSRRRAAKPIKWKRLDGFSAMTEALSDRIQIVGDDLLSQILNLSSKESPEKPPTPCSSSSSKSAS